MEGIKWLDNIKWLDKQGGEWEVGRRGGNGSSVFQLPPLSRSLASMSTRYWSQTAVSYRHGVLEAGKNLLPSFLPPPPPPTPSLPLPVTFSKKLCYCLMRSTLSKIGNNNQHCRSFLSRNQRSRISDSRGLVRRLEPADLTWSPEAVRRSSGRLLGAIIRSETTKVTGTRG